MPCSLLAAISFADSAHRGQVREDGTPYIQHPLAVLHILWQASLDLPLEAYVTAVLHDVLEDTSVKRNDILLLAGEDVTAAVEALTRPSFPRETVEDYVRRLLFDADAEPYVPLVKLADRIHNLETSSALEAGRAQALREETCGLYLPSFAARVPVSDPEVSAHAYLIARLRGVCAPTHAPRLRDLSPSARESADCPKSAILV